MKDLQFFNPYAEIDVTENRLPHWQQSSAVYFITFRLADAIPAKMRSQWIEERKVWCRLHPKPWSFRLETEYHRRFSGTTERWLDAGYGSCVLRQPGIADFVAVALRHFDGQRFLMISLIVMPNHVHTLFVLRPRHSLEKVIGGWKTYTSRRINLKLDRSGQLWQKDYFDRLVRDRSHFENCVRYIRRNPRKARLPKTAYALYESPAAKEIE